MSRKPIDCGDLGHDERGCSRCGLAHADVGPDPATGVFLCGPCWWAAFVALRRSDSLRARRRSA